MERQQIACIQNSLFHIFTDVLHFVILYFRSEGYRMYVLKAPIWERVKMVCVARVAMKMNEVRITRISIYGREGEGKREIVSNTRAAIVGAYCCGSRWTIWANWMGLARVREPHATINLCPEASGPLWIKPTAGRRLSDVIFRRKWYYRRYLLNINCGFSCNPLVDPPSDAGKKNVEGGNC